MSATPEPFVDAHEVARRLGVGLGFIYQEAAAGHLPSYPLGTGSRPRRRFKMSEVERWMEEWGAL